MNLLQKLGIARRPPVRSERFFIAEVSPLALPEDYPVLRTAPRPVERQEPGYAAEFDWTHLFYDIYWGADRLEMIGPPLRNLADFISPSHLTIDGQAFLSSVRTMPLADAELTIVETEAQPQKLDFHTKGYQTNIVVQPSRAEVFSGARAITTLSKDNRLEWIADWAEFHVRVHGVDAAVFYDNASSRYGVTELLDCLSSVKGLSAVAVVPWPYKYGPRGIPGNWDSSFCQQVMIEHARRRFLREAAAMVNLDVDELIVTEDGASLFEHLDKSPSGALIYPGRWIDNVTTSRFLPPRHRRYRHYVPDGPLYLPKWTIVPSRLPETVATTIHRVFGDDFQPFQDPQILYRHFRAISTNWFYQRTRRRPLRRSHKVDEAWVQLMRKIGWSR
ncbi:MAG: hypothetical protein ABIO40_03205 [Devosia sp.]